MRVKLFCILFLILLSTYTFSISGPVYIRKADCEKDGSLKLFFGSFSTAKVYSKDIFIEASYIGDIIKNQNFVVNGEWNFDHIKSDEETTILTTSGALFNLTGDYSLTISYRYKDDPYLIEYNTRCPGFEFSCKLLDVKVDYCKNINKERFEASARILGFGEISKENLTLDNNIQFMLNAKEDYEDYKGKFSNRGSLPKDVIINNPTYGQYFFNVSNFNNSITSFVAKIIGINHIAGGCVNYPNISLYSYKECEDVMIDMPIKEEKKPEQPVITSQTIKETKQEILEELEVNTSKDTNTPLFVLIGVFLLCTLGVLYILLKRNFNKESSF